MAANRPDAEELERALERTRADLRQAQRDLAEQEAAWQKCRHVLTAERESLEKRLQSALLELQGLRQSARLSVAREAQRTAELERRLAIAESDLRRAHGGAA